MQSGEGPHPGASGPVPGGIGPVPGGSGPVPGGSWQQPVSHPSGGKESEACYAQPSAPPGSERIPEEQPPPYPSVGFPGHGSQPGPDGGPPRYGGHAAYCGENEYGGLRGYVNNGLVSDDQYQGQRVEGETPIMGVVNNKGGGGGMINGGGNVMNSGMGMMNNVGYINGGPGMMNNGGCGMMSYGGPSMMNHNGIMNTNGMMNNNMGGVMNTGMGGMPIMMQPLAATSYPAPPGVSGSSSGPSIVITNTQTVSQSATAGGGKLADGGLRDWRHGLCDCCADCYTCACGTFCPCFVLCTNANALNVNGFLFCCMSCSLFLGLGCFLPDLLVRSMAREKYNIRGSGCGDCMKSFFCTCCSTIQVANEIRVAGDLKKKQARNATSNAVVSQPSSQASIPPGVKKGK